MTIIQLIAMLCQIHANDTSRLVNKEQAACHNYYADCLIRSDLRGKMDDKLLVCMAARPASLIGQ